MQVYGSGIPARTVPRSVSATGGFNFHPLQLFGGMLRFSSSSLIFTEGVKILCLCKGESERVAFSHTARYRAGLTFGIFPSCWKNETVQVICSSSLQEKPARWHCCSSSSDLGASQSTGSFVTSPPALLRGEMHGNADTEQKGVTRPDFCYAVGFVPVLALFSLGSLCAPTAWF